MKALHNNRFILALACLLTLASCTLTLDDMSDQTESSTPNGDGITSPCTEVEGGITTTYMFREGVTVINERYLPYILNVTGDSLYEHIEIYFTANTPAELLPQPDDGLGSLSDFLPTVLSHIVRTVEKSGGMYKVCAEWIPLQFIFKDFKMEGDVLVVPDKKRNAEARTRAGGADEGVMYCKTVPAPMFMLGLTRADDEEIDIPDNFEDFAEQSWFNIGLYEGNLDDLIESGKNNVNRVNSLINLYKKLPSLKNIDPADFLSQFGEESKNNGVKYKKFGKIDADVSFGIQLVELVRFKFDIWPFYFDFHIIDLLRYGASIKFNSVGGGFTLPILGRRPWKYVHGSSVYPDETIELDEFMITLKHKDFKLGKLARVIVEPQFAIDLYGQSSFDHGGGWGYFDTFNCYEAGVHIDFDKDEYYSYPKKGQKYEPKPEEYPLDNIECKDYTIGCIVRAGLKYGLNFGKFFDIYNDLTVNYRHEIHNAWDTEKEMTTPYQLTSGDEVKVYRGTDAYINSKLSLSTAITGTLTVTPALDRAGWLGARINGLLEKTDIGTKIDIINYVPSGSLHVFFNKNYYHTPQYDVTVSQADVSEVGHEDEYLYQARVKYKGGYRSYDMENPQLLIYGTKTSTKKDECLLVKELGPIDKDEYLLSFYLKKDKLFDYDVLLKAYVGVRNKDNLFTRATPEYTFNRGGDWVNVSNVKYYTVTKCNGEKYRVLVFDYKGVNVSKTVKTNEICLDISFINPKNNPEVIHEREFPFLSNQNFPEDKSNFTGRFGYEWQFAGDIFYDESIPASLSVFDRVELRFGDTLLDYFMSRQTVRFKDMQIIELNEKDTNIAAYFLEMEGIKIDSSLAY